jgi:hypothetical protein
MDRAFLTPFIDDFNCTQRVRGGTAESRSPIDEF